MSALENELTPETSNGGTPVTSPFTEPAAGADSSSAPVPAAKEDRRDTLARLMKESNPDGKPRDERGKFAPGKPAEAVPADAAPSRPAMPKSYKKELESHWNTLPTEFAASVVQREADYEKGVTPLKEKARIADELLNEFKPVEHLLRMTDSTPLAAIRDYVKTATIFQSGTPALKAQAVAQIMRQYSIPVEHLQQVLSGQGASQTAAFDPSQITELVEQRLNSFQQQQSEQATATEIEKFAANPEFKHFDEVCMDMSDVMRLESFVAAHQNDPPQDKLKAAYDRALLMNPGLGPQLAAEQQAATAAQRQVAQARNAAVLVKGSPPSGPATKLDPRDRQAVLKHAFQVHR